MHSLDVLFQSMHTGHKVGCPLCYTISLSNGMKHDLSMCVYPYAHIYVHSLHTHTHTTSWQWIQADTTVHLKCKHSLQLPSELFDMHISSMKVFSQVFNLFVKLPKVHDYSNNTLRIVKHTRLHHTHMGTHPWVGCKHTFSQPPAAQPSSPIVEHVPDWLPASRPLACKL